MLIETIYVGKLSHAGAAKWNTGLTAFGWGIPLFPP